MANVYGFSESAGRQVWDAVRFIRRDGEKVILPQAVGNGVRYWEGTLQEDLEPSTSRTGTGYTKAAFRFLTLDPDNAGKSHLKQTELEDECINRDKFQVAFDGEYVAGLFRFGRYEVLWPGRRALYGKADSNIASSSTGTVSLYESTSTDSTLDLTGVHNITDQQADSGNWVEVIPMEVWDLWVLKPVECPA